MMSKLRRVGRSLVPVLSLVALAAAAAYPIFSFAGTETFEYDELGRLKKIIYVNGMSISYALDAAGNRTAVSNNSSSSSSGGPTYVAITSSNGTILASASTLYVVDNSCSSGQFHTACTWLVRKLYGDQSAVIAVVRAPDGAIPACTNGTTQNVTAGYVRSGCSLSALSTVYGN